MTQAIQLPRISFFPSSVNEFFSISYKEKIHELPPWQKTAIILTSIAGIALFGIGILFGFGLSYYFRSRLVEQIAADTSILAQMSQINESGKPNPAIVIEPPKPALEPRPVLTDTAPKTDSQTVKSDLAIVIEPPKPVPELQPTLTTMQGKQDSAFTQVSKQTLQEAQQAAPIADDQLLKQQVEKIRTAIDQTRYEVIPLKEEFINDKTLEKWSMEGRHFLSIANGRRGHKIPDFSPLLLPKGIYCIYWTDKNDIAQEQERNDKYSRMIIDQFGENNVYHLVICEHQPKYTVSLVHKIHKHQLELYAQTSINDLINQNCIEEFEEHLKANKKM